MMEEVELMADSDYAPLGRTHVKLQGRTVP